MIPKEGSVVVPYVMSAVKNSPHPENGYKVLDFVLSDKGQQVWANAFLRPVISSAMTPEIEAKFLPAKDYQRAKTVDFAKMAEAQSDFAQGYLKEVR